jgi:hypothetical protein
MACCAVTAELFFEMANMVADIVLGFKCLSASRAGRDHPSVPSRPSRNHCVLRKERKARSFRIAPLQGPGADYLSIPEMYLLPGVSMIGLCLHFGCHVFNPLRRRKLQDPSISAC